MSTKFTIDPKTGRMSTDGYDTPAMEHVKKDIERDDLAAARRELRDMLSGNTQFHEDPLAKPGPVADTDEPGLCLDSGEFVPAGELTDQQRNEIAQHMQGAPAWANELPNSARPGGLIGFNSQGQQTVFYDIPFKPNREIEELQRYLVDQAMAACGVPGKIFVDRGEVSPKFQGLGIQPLFAGVDLAAPGGDKTVFRSVVDEIWAKQCLQIEENSRETIRKLAVEAGFTRAADGTLFVGPHTVSVDNMLMKFALAVLKLKGGAQ